MIKFLQNIKKNIQNIKQNIKYNIKHKHEGNEAKIFFINY